MRQLQRADVLDRRFAPTVDVRPLAVAHAVLVTRHVDYVALPFRAAYGIVRLFVGDDDQTVVVLLLVQAGYSFSQLRAVVALARVDGIALQMTASTVAALSQFQFNLLSWNIQLDDAEGADLAGFGRLWFCLGGIVAFPAGVEHGAQRR